MSTLRERVIAGLEERRNKILNGGINSIPSPFVRFQDDFLGIEQAKFYLITSSTKGAKTQFASYVFIYNTLMYAYNHPEQVRVKIFYYPLEETPEDIMLRFMSYILYTISEGKVIISPTDLSSTRTDKIVNKEILDLLDSSIYQDLLQFFEEHIIFSSSANPTGVYSECKKYAEENGIVHRKPQKIKDELGVTKEVESFDYYVQNDPDEYRIIFIDHVSLISTERGMSLKQSIDKLSEYCVILRNRYKFSPVLIQQQAFAGESLDAYKENKVRPTIANLSDSKYPSRDCNICLGLFSPLKHGLHDYMGYDIGILKDNVRFLEVLINRGGAMGGLIALYFEGACCGFTELPLPNTPEIESVYKWLKNKNSKKQENKSFLSYGINKTNKELYNKNMFYKFATLLNRLKKK